MVSTDIQGKKFGLLTAIRYTGEQRHSSAVWLCKCDCGNEKEVVRSSLVRGDTRSCGCIIPAGCAKPKAARLEGQVFSRLTVIERAGKKSREAAWKCLCSCGVETIVTTGALRSGHTQSCGCLLAERSAQSTTKNLLGQRFGRLVVTERAGSTGQGGARWACLCDCGSQKVVAARNLIHHRTISCGCAQIDKPGLRPLSERERVSAEQHKRRARIKGVGGSFTPAQIRELLKKQRCKCAWCKTSLADGYHRDHRIALVDGGSNDIANIELLCGPCNLKKNAKDPIVWANMNGRLI